MQSDTTQTLLERYGGIVGLDATHSTNKDGKQLYTLVVITEAEKIVPVAMFVGMQDDKFHVSAALHAVWQAASVQWRPSVFMIDDADHGA